MNDKLHLVYDGDCAFCTRTLRIFQRLDVWRRLELHDARSRAAVLARFESLDEADLDDAMFAVQGNRSWRGFFAFRQVVRQSPFTWILMPLFYAPGASRLGPRIYALVARNRRPMGCAAETCRAPWPGSSPSAHRPSSER